jgi:hypothetical protein
MVRWSAQVLRFIRPDAYPLDVEPTTLRITQQGFGTHQQRGP